MQKVNGQLMEGSDDVQRPSNGTLRVVSIDRQRTTEADNTGGCAVNVIHWWLTLMIVSMEDERIRIPTTQMTRTIVKASGSVTILAYIWQFRRLTKNNRSMVAPMQSQ